MKNAFVIIGALAYGFVVELWRGYVLSVLWGWFVVTAFALPPISFAQGAGLALMVGLATSDGNPGDSKGKELERLIYCASLPAFAVLFGWLYLQLV